MQQLAVTVPLAGNLESSASSFFKPGGGFFKLDRFALLAGGSSRDDTAAAGSDATGGRFLLRVDRRTASSEAADTVLSSSASGFLRVFRVFRRLGRDGPAAALPTSDGGAAVCARICDLLVGVISEEAGPDAGGSGEEENEIC